MSPASFHKMPESCTAIRTSGRPVSRRHAISMLMPLTPFSSLALAFTAGSVGQKVVLADFHFSPLQLPAPPPLSLGRGVDPGGIPPVVATVGVAPEGGAG